MIQRKDVLLRFTEQPSIFALLFALLFSAGCLYGQDVHYNYDRAANFSVYKTYQWVDTQSVYPKVDDSDHGQIVTPPSGLAPILRDGAWSGLPSLAANDQLVGEDIKRAVDEQLSQKGLTRVEKGGDLLVAYHAVVHEEKGVDLTGTAWGGRGYGLWDGSVHGQTSTLSRGYARHRLV